MQPGEFMLIQQDFYLTWPRTRMQKKNGGAAVADFLNGETPEPSFKPILVPPLAAPQLKTSPRNLLLNGTPQTEGLCNSTISPGFTKGL